MATWLESDGTQGIASTDGTSLDLSGDVDLRVRARAVDWSPPSVLTLLSKRDSSTISTAEWQWTLEANSSLTRWRWQTTAAANLSVVTGSHGGVDGGWVSVRLTFDVDDGAGNRVTRLWTRADDDIASDSGWTEVGTGDTTAGTTDIRTNAATVMEVGSLNSDGSGWWNGGFAKALVMSGRPAGEGGAGTTVIASPDFTNLTAGQTSMTDAQDNVWTFRSGVTIEGLAQQVLYPDETISAGSWETESAGASLHLSIDDTAGAESFTDHARSPDDPTNEVAVVRLPPLIAPAAGVGADDLTLYPTYDKEGVATISLVYALWQNYNGGGGTQLATATDSDVTDATESPTLTASTNAITFTNGIADDLDVVLTADLV